MLRRSVDRLVRELEVDSYSALVRSCTTLQRAKWLHRRISRNVHARGNIYLSNLLMEMYGRCGSLESARHIFDGMKHRNTFTWNIMIRTCAHLGHPLEAMQLYYRMDVAANEFTFSSLLSVSSALGDLELGQHVHRSMLALGVTLCIVVQSSLVNMYAKCGRIDTAREIFDGIADKSVVSWNAMISAYAQKGHYREALELFNKMEVQPSKVTFLSVIAACTNVKLLRWIHGKIIEQGLGAGLVIATSLINMYAKCGSLLSAKQVFDGMLERNAVTWNTMVTAYAQAGDSRRAMELFGNMDLEGVCPDEITFATVLSACWSLCFRQGRMLHWEAEQCGCGNALVVMTAVVTMYARCNRLDIAMEIFQVMKADGDVVAWNSIISACAHHGEPREAVELYRLMDVEPDRATLTSVLSACSTLGDLESGKEVHERIRKGKQSLQKDLSVQNAVLNMYSKCGKLEVARSFFNEMPEKNVVTHNVMMTSYTQQGFGNEAIRLFREMDLQGLEADEVTLTTVITACSYVGALDVGRQAHCRYITRGCSNMIVETAVVNMYGRCGTLQEARDVFHSMRRKNTLAWNAILAACAHRAGGREAIELFRESSSEGYCLDETSFVSILIACSRSGLLEQAWEHFVLMASDWKIVPVAEHYRCLIDILGRAGRLTDAEDLVTNMPFQPDAVSWRTFLGSCRTQEESQTASTAARLALDSEGS